MSQLQELQENLLGTVIQQLVPDLAKCISLQKEDRVQINTVVGIFTYVPFSQIHASYRLEFDGHRVYATRGLGKKPTLGNVDNYTDWAEKEILRDLTLGEYSEELRKVVNNIYPAKSGPEKVEVDYEDLQNLISLATAMAPGILPKYVDNLRTQAKGCMRSKLQHLIDMPGHAEDKIGHAKRLTNLMEKFQ